MSRFAGRTSLKRRRLLVGCLFAVSLSLVAGMTDAVGFLAAGDFVAFMSGNTTRMSIAVAESRFEPALRLAFILCAFVAGNTFGVVLAKLCGNRQIVLLAVVAFLTSAGVFQGQVPFSVLSVAFAMGIINVVLEEVNGQPLGVSYVTGALSRFGRGLGRLLLGEGRSGWWLQILPWLGLFAGTVIGAFLHAALGPSAFLACGASALLLGVVSLAIPTRWRRGFTASPSPQRAAKRRIEIS